MNADVVGNGDVSQEATAMTRGRKSGNQRVLMSVEATVPIPVMTRAKQNQVQVLAGCLQSNSDQGEDASEEAAIDRTDKVSRPSTKKQPKIHPSRLLTISPWAAVLVTLPFTVQMPNSAT